MKKIFQKQNSGFTLIEMMVAIVIFTFSLLGIVVIMGGSISDTTLAKNRIIASYLAQEGVEVMRNFRDTSTLYGGSTGWADFSLALETKCINGVEGCYFNPELPSDDPNYLTSCLNSCPELTYSDLEGYNYSSSQGSGFSRIIEVKMFSSEEIGIISNVSWTKNGNLHEIEFSDVFFNWIQPL